MEVWREAGSYLLRLPGERAEWKFREGKVVIVLRLAGERAGWKFGVGQVVNLFRLAGDRGRSGSLTGAGSYSA